MRVSLLNAIVFLVAASLIFLTLLTRERTGEVPNQREQYSAVTADSKPVEVCPYYPSDAVDIVSRIFAWESVLEFRSQLAVVPRSKPIHLLLASESTLPLFANWLCVSRTNLDDLENVLVIAPPGDFMASILRSKGIRVVEITYSHWCQQRMLNGSEGKLPFMLAIAARVLSIRLLTSWGYDVAVYDTDAFVTGNSTQLYLNVVKELQADAVFQRGRYPLELSLSWGFTVCCGAAFYRGTARLEVLWKEMARMQYPLTADWQKFLKKEYRTKNKSMVTQLNDQLLTNAALFQLGIKWSQTNVYGSMLGSLDSSHKLNIVALGTNFSARYWPEEVKELAVSHPLLGHDVDRKMKQLDAHNLWKLAVKPHDLNDNIQYTNSKTWLKKICVAT